MKACEKCGMEINVITDGHPRTTPWHTHTPERCRDRLAARLAEAEQTVAHYRSWSAAVDEKCDALRAELAECRAELEAASADILTVMAGEKAAEARAERYENTLRDAEQWLGCEEPHVPSVLHNIRTALAETAPKTESRGIPRTDDDGERRGNVHPEPGTSSPDDAECAAREWWDANGEACECDAVHTHMTLPSLDALATLIRAERAQAREAGRVEGIEQAARALEDPRLFNVTPRLLELIRALKRPDRAKGDE